MNTFLNPNLAIIKFKCSFHTQFGEQIRLVGNIEELGSWEPSKSMVMNTSKDSYPIWESAQEITAPVGMEIYYKYVISNENKVYSWESLPNNCNRKHTISSSGSFTIFDEENTLKSCVQGEYNELKNENLEFDEIKEEIVVSDKSSLYNSLLYDSNNFGGNKLDDTFMFCVNHKISSEDRIIIASAHLPIEVDKTPDDRFVIRVTDESLIYSILYGMKEKEICEVVWIGMLKNYTQYSESELHKISEYLKDNNIYMIIVNENTYKNYWIYINNIIVPVFTDSTIDVHNQYFLNYEEYFDAYMIVNTAFSDKIHKIMVENDLLMINDIHLMLIPNGLLSKNTNSRVGIYFHMPFPSSDVLKTFPFHQELIKSVLLCDVIGFHVFQFARNFLTLCKRTFGLFYEIKFRGFITLNYLGRYIIIRIMHAGIDFDYVKSIIQKSEFSNQLDIFKNIIRNKFCLVSIDSPNFSSGLILKLESYKRFLEKYPEVRNNIVLIQIIKYDDNDISDCNFEKQLNGMINEIELEYKECLKIFKLNKFTVPQRFALFTLGSSLFYIKIREGNCMYVNEFIALQHIICKKINHYGIIISETIGVSSAIKGAFRINPFNINSIFSALEKVYYMKEDERDTKFNKDLNYVMQNTTFSWIKNFFIDLKRNSMNQSCIKIGVGMGLNFRLLKLNNNFRHLSKIELLEAYRLSKRRLIFLDYEGTILSCESGDDEKCTPDTRLLKLLTALSDDCRNLVFITSGRPRKHLDKWFSSVKNLSLASEHGFFYRFGNFYSSNNEWKELFNVKDWSWKDSVLKLLEGFTEKTEGSYIQQKEAIISWFYKDCDIYFGHIQANEISTHLQNIFENCKLDIVHGKGYVEIKPRNVNKGYFISTIIKEQFVEKMNPDFILSIGDDTSDEEMFKYLNSVHNNLSFLNENIQIFTCTIGRKPSSANFYLNEVPEVLEYLESLIHSNKKENFSAKKPMQSSRILCDSSIGGIRKNYKSESLGSLFQYNNFNI